MTLYACKYKQKHGHSTMSIIHSISCVHKWLKKPLIRTPISYNVVRCSYFSTLSTIMCYYSEVGADETVRLKKNCPLNGGVVSYTI